MQDTASHNVTLLNVFILWLGPILGPYLLIVFAAIAGAGLALQVEKPLNRWEGIKFLALSTLVALLLTGPLAWLVEKYTDVPANVALIPVAVVLGLARTRLAPLIHRLLDVLPAGASAASNTAGKRGGR